MSLINKGEIRGDSDTGSSVSSNELTSSVSCYTRFTGTTTTATSSNLGAVNDVVSNQIDEADTSAASASQKNATDESNALLENARDLVITRSQLTTGQKCDNSTEAIPTDFSYATENKLVNTATTTTRIIPSTSNVENGANRIASGFQDAKHVPIRFLSYTPYPSPRPSSIDNNNNKNGDISSPQSTGELLSGLRRTNFNKSASHSKLTSDNGQQHAATKNHTTKTTRPPHVCDCLAQNCQEKEHSNRRQFIEHYYHSRTRLPSSSFSAMSPLNVNTPLNRLSECDAITKRLLSSPIRGVSGNTTQSPERRTQVDELDRSRRASLGADTLTEQVSSFIRSNQFNSLELSYKSQLSVLQNDDDITRNDDDNLSGLAVSPTSELDIRLKHTQGRSLSVCHEETQKPRFRNSGSSSTNNNSHNHYHPYHHSSNLNRTVSLACDSGSSRRLLTIIPLFGCDITALQQLIKFGLILPPPIDSAVDHILAHGVESIGIFRKSGVKSRILTLRRRIETNQDVKLEELNRENEFSIYDIADLVKMWFRELKPVPIMTEELISIISDHIYQSETPPRDSIYSEKQQNYSSSHGYDRLRKQITSSISPTRRALFSRTLGFFSTIASHSESNQMTSQNLAICLTPSLCATGSDQNSIIIAQKALKYCLDNYRILF